MTIINTTTGLTKAKADTIYVTKETGKGLSTIDVTQSMLDAKANTFTVVNSAPTLEWNTSKTIGTVAGTALTVKLPANPNTDSAVLQSKVTDNTNRPLLMAYLTPDSASNVTGQVRWASGIYANSSTGALTATTFIGALTGHASDDQRQITYNDQPSSAPVGSVALMPDTETVGSNSQPIWKDNGVLKACGALQASLTDTQMAAVNSGITAEKVALIGVVPTKLSDLTDDGTHRLVTDTEKATWNAKQNAIPANTYAPYNSNGYLPLNGGTLTGVLKVNANQYGDDASSCGLNMQNSNIIKLNSIYTADLADDSREGIHFYRTSTTVDTLWIKNGVMYFAPNRTLNSGGTSYTVIHTGNTSSLTGCNKGSFGDACVKGVVTAVDATANLPTSSAVKTYVDTKVSGLVNSAPEALDTLNELATALGNDPNFATTVSTEIGKKVTANTAITGATKCKITYDNKGLVTAGADLSASDIPSLSTDKLTSGTLPVERGGTGKTSLGNVVVGYATYLSGDNKSTSSAALSIGKSTWTGGRPDSSDVRVWSQRWADSGLGTDTGDLNIWLHKVGSTSVTANLSIDGQIYAMGGFNGNLTGSCTGSAGSVAWANVTSKPLTLTANTTGFSIAGGTTSKTLTVTESYTLGAACAKGVYDSAAGTLGWVNNSTGSSQVPTITTMAYWNGAYNNTNSNLKYCYKGTLGDACVKAVDTSVSSTSSTNLPTTKAVAEYAQHQISYSASTPSGGSTGDVVVVADNESVGNLTTPVYKEDGVLKECSLSFGTVTAVKINGTSKTPSSGVADIGNVVTSVKINGTSKTPSSGVVDLGTIQTAVTTPRIYKNNVSILTDASTGTLELLQVGINSSGKKYGYLSVTVGCSSASSSTDFSYMKLSTLGTRLGVTFVTPSSTYYTGMWYIINSGYYKVTASDNWGNQIEINTSGNVCPGRWYTKSAFGGWPRNQFSSCTLEIKNMYVEWS